MTDRTDWPKILGDIAYLLGEPNARNPQLRDPISSYQLADALHVPRGTLRGWMDGSEPKHTDGERLLERWCALTGRSRSFAPVCRVLSAAQAR